MTINLGVKALLSWVNSITLFDRELDVNDFQDGTVLLKVVYMLKQEPISTFTNSVEDHFRLIAEFLERDCRLNATKGTPLSWNNIRHGINLTVEVAKVLLLLVYHDMMNDRRTLNKLDCDMEREIANLTTSFVMESEGCVYLANGLDGYLARKYLPVSSDVFDNTGITSLSSSNMSTVSSLSDEDSPVFHRSKQKITFVELQTVASSSLSKSPLQDIMNTPKFQMRKLQRQMIKERDYRDGLERELSTKLTVIAQKEMHINQLQYRLDKLKEEQNDGENAIREQIAELEDKNNTLQMRLNEILKENKEFRSTSSLMEHKMDELTEENGILSSQMRTVRSQLAIFEAEVGLLRENQASAEKEWKDETSQLESELNQVITQKELLTEQIEILQGKISCLEDELSSVSNEDMGENMGPIMERELFETEIKSLKNELERALCSLNEAELCMQAKTQQLAECQEEMIHQKDLLHQMEHQTKQLIQEKDEMLDKLQQELTGQSVVLQEEIKNLKFQLHQAEQQKCEQISRLQQHIVVNEQEIEKLKKSVKEKEDLISLTEENIKDLKTKVSALNSLLIDKDKEINSLRKEVDILEEESKRNKNELQIKDNMFSTLTLEKCNQQQLLQSQIKLFTNQVEDLTLSLKQAEQEIQNKQDFLVESQKLNIQQQELLQQQIIAYEDNVQTLTKEVHVKNELLAILKNDSSSQIGSLEKERELLKGQLEHLNNNLRKAEQQLQNEKVKLVQHEKESTDQIQILQQQLCASEDEVRAIKDEMCKREDQITTLEKQSLEQSQKSNKEINELQNQIQSLQSSIKKAEEHMQSKENLLVEQNLQASRDMEALQVQMVTSQQEAEVLCAKVCEKEEQILLLKTENASHSKLSQEDIESLNKQMQTIRNSLELTQKELQIKEDMMAKQEQDGIYQKELLCRQLKAAEEEVKRLVKDSKSKEEQMIQQSSAKSAQFDLLHKHIVELHEQIGCLSSTLENAGNTLQSKEKEFAEHHLQSAHEVLFQKKMETTRGEMKRLKAEIRAKEGNLTLLINSTSVNSELLQQEIACVTTWISRINELLGIDRSQSHAKEELLLKQEQENILQIEELKRHNSVLEEGISLLKEEIQTKEREINMIQTEKSNESEIRNIEIQTLTDKIKGLNVSMKSSIEQYKLVLWAQDLETSQEGSKVLREQITPLRTTGSLLLCEEIQTLKIQMENLDSLLRKAWEELKSKDNVLFQKEEENTQLRESIQRLQEKLIQLEKQILSQEEQIEKQKNTEKEREHLLLKTDERLQILQNELSAVNMVIGDKDRNLKALEEELAVQANMVQKDVLAYEKTLNGFREEHSEHVHTLQQEIQQINEKAEIAFQKLMAKEQEVLQMKKDSVEQVNLLQQQLTSANAEKQAAHDLRLAAHKDKEVLLVRIGQAEKDQRALEKQLDAAILQKDQLMQAKESIERKSEIAEHYKAQMEKAVSHYNNKKQLLQESQEEVTEIKQSLELTERQLRAAITENKMLQLDLDKAQTNEKKLVTMVTSLEAQLAFADQKLRAQNEILVNGNSDGTYTSLGPHSRPHKKRAASSDSLDQSSLEDSLNNTRHFCTPDESSTPVVRSSERLATKRRGLHAESLETLYFTPMNRNGKDNKMEFVSGCKSPASSVKRRRTTQVISITMTKKTPGSCEDEETFGSLSSAVSHPNLSTLARKTPPTSDQLIGLPGYRRSAVYSKSTSTFCVGTENEPDGAPEDWMRIAELQARNKACLPHLKSSYPVEFDTGSGSALVFTDEELRTGDPCDTIRRASMMPSQLQDSLSSHRLSLMMANSGPSTNTRSHRLSYMPSNTISSTRLRSPKDTKMSSSTTSVLQTSPEKKVKASCFPRPLTPKNKNVLSGPSNSLLHPTLSPVTADRRQSMAFTIENTPKNTSYLKKSLNKLRSSTRKIPSKGTKKSPAQTIKNRGQENMFTKNIHTAVGQASRNGKSPQLATKGQKKYLEVKSGRSTKSPRLTANVQKKHVSVKTENLAGNLQR